MRRRYRQRQRVEVAHQVWGPSGCDPSLAQHCRVVAAAMVVGDIVGAVEPLVRGDGYEEMATGFRHAPELCERADVVVYMLDDVQGRYHVEQRGFEGQLLDDALDDLANASGSCGLERPPGGLDADHRAQPSKLFEVPAASTARVEDARRARRVWLRPAASG